MLMALAFVIGGEEHRFNQANDVGKKILTLCLSLLLREIKERPRGRSFFDRVPGSGVA
ncbi:hypothetical protein AGR2A_pa30035 [Agrobacterium genomosp. 2 str. CFBP 5494]|uniref:Uncharacterized protein n=1 Tax=Agrobacterium genomosp. 2 str. CFBP 5494 TaxID=1183436 RepID=A0A9W5B6S2_9HYPH|nr:hypothetical protein AGR2A_pa30035 [Agrobacterium genomosp. 2 str. CFBP 5494]